MFFLTGLERWSKHDFARWFATVVGRACLEAKRAIMLRQVLSTILPTASLAIQNTVFANILAVACFAINKVVAPNIAAPRFVTQ